ncbi:thioredoxin-disulfide reductase [Streptomyces sp. NBC_00237]|uniref:thioredoxin-disulfide reductase n=1 Tax=Streptomyces sp. NBC_00237 TaxID=2975687 RepID=UPI002254E579|nr:thioredoxin-disulfide reductase [Streptomyces sp. NBC_00237]MCX5205961.1 thioredoxin-disulfide reductase [Streptomyces sp. NBC_00237]
MSEIRDVVIIGSGPAGYTAALYTARAQLKPLLFGSSIFVGGSLTTTTEVENYPGFPDGVDGPVLMENMRAQAEKFDAEMIDDDIVSVDLTGDIKLLTDSEGTVHRAKTVIIATGSGYRKLGLPNEDALSGRGVSWCATCDGFFFRERDIVVVGGGDTAMEEATFLTRFACSVTVVHRRSTLRASKVMQDRAFADDKISFAFDTEIAEIKEANGMLGGVVLRDVFTGATRTLDVTGLFIAIGHDPRTELFTQQLDLNAEGYIKVASPSTRTSLPGVFAAGDVVDHIYRQAITAAGTGAAAALDAERYLSATKSVQAERVPASVLT